MCGVLACKVSFHFCQLIHLFQRKTVLQSVFKVAQPVLKGQKPDSLVDLEGVNRMRLEMAKTLMSHV